MKDLNSTIHYKFLQYINERAERGHTQTTPSLIFYFLLIFSFIALKASFKQFFPFILVILNPNTCHLNMAKIKITVEGYKCERCTHEWIPRNKETPIICPKCKSPYWNKPKKR